MDDSCTYFCNRYWSFCSYKKIIVIIEYNNSSSDIKFFSDKIQILKFDFNDSVPISKITLEFNP